MAIVAIIIVGCFFFTIKPPKKWQWNLDQRKMNESEYLPPPRCLPFSFVWCYQLNQSLSKYHCNMWWRYEQMNMLPYIDYICFSQTSTVYILFYPSQIYISASCIKRNFVSFSTWQKKKRILFTRIQNGIVEFVVRFRSLCCCCCCYFWCLISLHFWMFLPQRW